MKNVRVLGTLLIAGSLALALPFASQARSGVEAGCQTHAMHGKHHAKGGFGERAGFMRGIDLSEAQRDQIFKLRHEAAPTLREKGKQAHAARAELRKLAQAENFDEAKARALSEQAARADAEFKFERLRLKQQILATLTPEQRKQAEAKRKQFGEKHRHGGRHDAHPAV